MQQQLAEMVRRSRRRIGVSQEALAERVGLHPTNLSKLERGHFTPNAALLLALMRELHIPPTALTPIIGGATDKRAALEIELANIAAGLTDQGLEIAIDQTRALERLSPSSKGIGTRPGK